MRGKRWMTAAGLGLGAIAVLAMLPIWGPSSKPSPSAPVPSSRPQAAAFEAHNKERTVLQDVKATERLSRLMSARDARQFFRMTANRSGAKFDLRAFVQQHPELVAVTWMRANGSREQMAGRMTPGMRDASSAYWAKGKKALRSGVSYSSPVFTHKGKHYFVHAESSSPGNGLLMLVSSNVKQVEALQRRNLRLIPYPAEGRYRIESALPNSTIDTTVRTGEDNGNVSHYSVDEVVVKFRDRLRPEDLLKLRKELDLTVIRHTRNTYVFRSKKHDAKELIAYFKSKWNPVFVEPHYLYLTNELGGGETDPLAIVPNDTLYSEYQWNLPQIETEEGWKWNRGRDDIIVAVVDTGVQLDHPDLKGRLVKGTNIVDPSSPPEDDVGHGTHVAGIIAAQVNNNEGVAGLTWYTKIMPVKALDSTGAGSTYSVAEGIIWAVDHGANVINMSLGNYAQAQFLHDAIKYAHDHGVVLVAASGNDNTDRPGYPAAYPEVIAVAATDPGEGKAEYSNFGDYIDVAAPGTSIASTYPGSRYAALSGTSMACPHVSALASLILAANPQLTNDQVADTLRKTAKDLGDKGKDNVFGYGEIDVRTALQTAGGQASSLQMYPEQIVEQLRRLLNL